MSAWDELVTTALLGTERRSLPEGLPEPVARLARAQGDRALSVLDAAAGYAALRRGGARPGSCPEPPLAPRQDLDLAAEPAQALLGSLLGTRDTALVDLWLRTCVDHGLGVRAGWWAALATAAAGPGGPDRRLVRAAMGARGRAFLATNPRWRAVARQPAAAADAASSGPDTGVDPELTARALRLVETRGPRHRRVRVRPDPGEIAATVPHADLDAWEGHTGLAPHDLLEALRRDPPDLLDDLVAGWADATVRQRHVGWATALVGHGYARDDLLALVPPERWATVVRGWSRGRDPDRTALLLATVPGPWDDVVAQVALRLLASRAVGSRTSRRVVPVVAVRLPLGALPAVADLAEAERDGEPAAGFVEVERVLRLRAEIDRCFRPGPTPEPQEHP